MLNSVKTIKFALNPINIRLYMAYTNQYLNNRILKITAIFDKYDRIGVPSTRIYKDYILPEFDISFSTFRNYLGKSEEVKIKLHQEKKQLAIQFTD